MEKNWSFKIVIAYETFHAAIHAKEMSERVAAEMESEVDAWPFELLAVKRLREHAIRMAAEADMIILAARGSVELPDGVKNWLANVMLQKRNNPAALVALLQDDWIISGRPPPLSSYLQQIAERGNVDFFCNLVHRREPIDGGHLCQEPGFKRQKAAAPAYADSQG